MGLATYHVCADGRSVLELEARPGTLHSTASPPPDWQPPRHPFVHAVATDPMHEHELRELLVASADVVDFLRRCVAAGYDVADGSISRWDLEEARRIRGPGGELLGSTFACPGPLATLVAEIVAERRRYDHAAVCLYGETHLDAVAEALEASDSYDGFAARLSERGLALTRR